MHVVLAIILAASATAAPAPENVMSRPEGEPQLWDALAALKRDVEALRAQVAAAPGDPALAATLASLEGRMAAFERALRTLQAEQERAAEAAARATEAEGRRPTLTVYGTLDATAFRNQNAILDGRAVELVVSGRPHRRLGFFAELEFERVAGLGAERGGELVVEQAYANYVISPAVNLRAGVLLVPFGNVSIDHFAPQRDVVTKPIVAWAVAPTDWTDNGLGFYGRLTLGSGLRLGYEAYLVAGLGGTVDALGARLARQGYGVDNNGDKALVGRIALDRAGDVQVGVSGYSGDIDDAGRQRLGGWAVDGLLRLGRLKLTGEYDQMEAGRAVGRPKLSSFYVRATVDLGKGLLPAVLARDFEQPGLALVAQFDDVRARGTGSGGLREANRERRATAGLVYRPAREWVLKVFWEHDVSDGRPLMQGDARGFVGSIGFVF